MPPMRRELATDRLRIGARRGTAWTHGLVSRHRDPPGAFMSSSATPHHDIATISHEELRRQRRELVIVDVLPLDSWTTGRIPGAISLPIAELTSRAAAVLPDRDADIVVYCAAYT